MTPAFDAVLAAARAAHAETAPLARFCAFPDDLAVTPVAPHLVPAAALLAREPGFHGDGVHPLGLAFIAAGRFARWRETYEHSGIGQDFLDRFGCYCLIGPGGPFSSRQMNAFVVYMPAGLHYPWHHHPAEEIYLVLAGKAEFHRAGEPSETLGAGQSSFHTSGQPHAMTTRDRPVLAYVLWRNHFDTLPVLTRAAETT